MEENLLSFFTIFFQIGREKVGPLSQKVKEKSALIHYPDDLF